MNIAIDKPKIEDVRDIQDVFFKTWLDTYPNIEVGVTEGDIEEKFKDRHSENAIQKRIADIENNLDDKIFLVAKDNNKVVGLCKASKTDEFNQLDAIYILPEYQGRGMGKMFWGKCIEFFDKNKDVIVRVAEYNKQAIEFYEKLGFVDTGKRFVEEKLRMPLSGIYITEMEMILKF